MNAIPRGLAPVFLAAFMATGCGTTNSNRVVLDGITYRPLPMRSGITEVPPGTLHMHGKLWAPAEGPAVGAPLPVRVMPPSDPKLLPAPQPLPPASNGRVLPDRLPDPVSRGQQPEIEDDVIPKGYISGVKPHRPEQKTPKSETPIVLEPPVSAAPEPKKEDQPLKAPPGSDLPERIPAPVPPLPTAPAAPTIPVPPPATLSPPAEKEPQRLPPLATAPVDSPKPGIPKITLPPALQLPPEGPILPPPSK